MKNFAIYFIFGYAIGVLLLFLLNAAGTPNNDSKIEKSQFEIKCKVDNGVVINADKPYCIKQGVVLEVGR